MDKIRDYFKKDRFAADNNINIESMGEYHAVCSMVIEEKHRNADNHVMGGAIFTLADFTFAVAANSMGIGTISLDANISFTGRAKGTKLIAEAKALKVGRRAGYYMVEVKDDIGNLVACVNVNGFNTKG